MHTSLLPQARCSPCQFSRSCAQRTQERLSTSKTELGIFTAGSAFVRASRAFQRRLCIDWQKVSLWNWLAIHLQPSTLLRLLQSPQLQLS